MQPKSFSYTPTLFRACVIAIALCAAALLTAPTASAVNFDSAYLTTATGWATYKEQFDIDSSGSVYILKNRLRTGGTRTSGASVVKYTSRL